MAKSDCERENTRRFREMRREIIGLRKENAALRKALHKLEQQMYNSSAEDEDELRVIQESVQPQTISKTEENGCPSCGAYGIVVFDLIGKTYFRCDSCSSKGLFKL